MKRFLMFVGVAAVAGAMYVAAASGSQQSRGPSAKQFAALKKQVATLEKKAKTDEADTNALAGVVLDCILDQVVPTNQFGDTSGAGMFGYSFTAAGGGGTTLTSAFDLAPDPSTAGWLLTGVPRQNAACMSLVGHVDGGLRHSAASRRAALQRYAAALAKNG